MDVGEVGRLVGRVHCASGNKNDRRKGSLLGLFVGFGLCIFGWKKPLFHGNDSASMNNGKSDGASSVTHTVKNACRAKPPLRFEFQRAAI